MHAISIADAYDLHVHSAPCIYPRIADDLTIATHARDAGLRGIVLKSHHEPTVGRAAIANTTLKDDGFRVFGSVTLNHAVGGVNPAAVDAALKTGARIIWMPTVDSHAHLLAFGHLAGWDVQGAEQQGHALAPLCILNDGELTEQAKAVVALCKQHRAALATGHLGCNEVAALARYAHGEAFAPLIVTHPNFRVPGLSLEEMRELTALGTYFEFTYCTISPMWRHSTIDDTVAAIRAVGVERAVLSSDGGQIHNPMPHEGLRLLAQMCHEKGLTADDLRHMISSTSARLLGLA